MQTIIIQTKLHPPEVNAQLVERPLLLQKLNQHRQRPLILVTAPAGYGKSTLLSRWLAAMPEEHTAWLSLESYDDDPATFWIYFTAAVQTMFPHVGQNTLSLLNQPEMPPSRVLLATLINELNVISENFILVLDDYHLIQQPAIHDLMTDLLTHIPATCHIVLASRIDPRLPIPKFRAQNLVIEIRAGDLRFSKAEADTFLRQSLKRPIADEMLSGIYQRSEGWVTGLHLAALSMRRLEQQPQLENILERENTFVIDYLMAEVLMDQPEIVQEWLLQTAVLDRFCPDLCDALFIDSSANLSFDGAQFIQHLTTHNLFIISLDQQQTWYRYHHLFSHFLKNEMQQRTATSDIAALHSKASHWLAQNQLLEEGLHHALAAEDVSTAAQIVEKNARTLLDEDRWHTLENWLVLLPESVIQQSAELLLAKAWATFHQFALWVIPPLLESIEKLLDEDDEEKRPLWGEVNFFWGHHWYWQGDQQRSLTYLTRALEQIPKTHHLARGEAELFWGLAMHMNTQKEAAVQQLHQWLYYEQALHPGRQTKLLASLIFIHLLSGELTDAAIVAQQAQDLAKKVNNTYVSAWTAYLLGLIHFCRNDLEGAAAYFNEAVPNRYILHKAAAIDSQVGLVLTYQALNRPEDASQVMSDLLTFAWETNNPAYITIARTCEARLLLMQGDLIKAFRRLQTADLSTATTTMFYWLETSNLTQCRVLIAHGTETSLGTADQKLETFWQQEQNNHNIIKMVEILLLQTMSYQKQARLADALVALNEAVLLASQGEYLRPFIEQGSELLPLVAKLSPDEITTPIIKNIKQALLNGQNQIDTQHHTTSPQPQMDEVLTYREKEILTLLATEISNQEIANQLTISPNTVKRHTSALYRKLAVKNRRQAVAKAKRAGLLASN